MIIMPDYQKIIIHYSWSKDHATLDWRGITNYHGSFRIDGVVVTPQEYVWRKRNKQGKRFERQWGVGVYKNGYHYGCEKVHGDYQCLIGRPLYMKGAHCRTQNSISIGVCLVGNYDTLPPENSAYEFMAKNIIVPLLWAFPKITIEKIEPHSKYSSAKTCPGKKFDMAKLRGIVQDVIG